jgi:hypothetical protein
MGTGDRYRNIIIISFILLIICIAALFISIWNLLGRNPAVHAGPALYFLILLILFLATLMFLFHLLNEKLNPTATPPEKEDIFPGPSYEPPQVKGQETPFEVDLDQIAESIIPRISVKETLEEYSETILLNLARYFEFVQGILYLKDRKTQEYKPIAAYAHASDKPPEPFRAGDGIPGQVAKSKSMMIITAIPEGYLKVQSGLGEASPGNLVIIPLLLNKETIGVIEFASFQTPDKEMEWTFRNLAKILSNAFVSKLKSIENK